MLCAITFVSLATLSRLCPTLGGTAGISALTAHAWLLVCSVQWKCGLLQRLSDLTLDQNDEKSATLHTLLESESMLDAGGAGSVCGGKDLSASDDGSDC